MVILECGIVGLSHAKTFLQKKKLHSGVKHDTQILPVSATVNLVPRSSDSSGENIW